MIFFSYMNGILRLGYEPLVIGLAVFLPFGLIELKRHPSVNRPGWISLLAGSLLVFTIRFIVLFFLNVHESRRYTLPLLFFILVFSGPIWVSGCRFLCTRITFLRSYKIGLMALLLAGYATSSVVKNYRENRPNRHVAVWSQEIRRIIPAQKIVFVDTSKRGKQILWESGLFPKDIIALNDSGRLFANLYSNQNLLAGEPEWWLMCQTSCLDAFAQDYRLYSRKYPFETYSLSFGYSLLHYYDNGICFSKLPAEHAKTEKNMSPSGNILPHGTKILLLGDALFCTGKVQKALLKNRPDLQLLGPEPSNIPDSPYRREGFENYGWDTLLTKTVLEQNGNGTFSGYCKAQLHGVRPDLVLISAGLSDLYEEGYEFLNCSAKSIEKMGRFLELLTNQEPSLKIAVIVPLPPPDSPKYQENPSLKIKHRAFIDYYGRMMQQTLASGTHRENIMMIRLQCDADCYSQDFDLTERCRNYMRGISDSAAETISCQLLKRSAELFKEKP